MNYCYTRSKLLCRSSKHLIQRYSQRAKKKTACELALEYFDVSYGNIYGKEWPSVRLGLLSEPKFVSIINNQCPNFQQTLRKLQNLGCYDVGAHYRKNCADVMAARQSSRLAQAHEQDKNDDDSPDVTGTHSNHSLRKPIRELSDDELGELVNTPAPPTYPKEFRDLSGNFEAVPSKPTSDRLILPQPHISIDMQIQALQEFMPSTGLKGLAELTDESEIFDRYRAAFESDDTPSINVEKSNTLIHWPELLTVLAFPRLDISRFPKPGYVSGLTDHYPLDGGSLLPVLLLDLQAGDSVLDLCAAPGGKSMAILQTTLPERLHSNDKSSARVLRLKTSMKQYFPEGSRALQSLRITQVDGTELELGAEGPYDRVLVDAPCLGDRYALHDADNNIFEKSRRQERLAMPEVQADLLVRALQLVRVGGTVVYSTCSLSPVQNDGVVHLALTRLWDHSKAQFSVIDYSAALEPLEFFLNFGKDLGLKYGQVVLPRASNNFGPTYCAKLRRKK